MVQQQQSSRPTSNFIIFVPGIGSRLFDSVSPSDRLGLRSGAADVRRISSRPDVALRFAQLAARQSPGRRPGRQPHFHQLGPAALSQRTARVLFSQHPRSLIAKCGRQLSRLPGKDGLIYRLTFLSRVQLERLSVRAKKKKQKKNNCGICQGLRTGRSAANSLDLTVEKTRNCLLLITIGFLRQKSKLLAVTCSSDIMALSLAHMHAAATGSERAGQGDAKLLWCASFQTISPMVAEEDQKIRDSIRRSRVAYTLVGRLQALLT